MIINKINEYLKESHISNLKNLSGTSTIFKSSSLRKISTIKSFKKSYYKYKKDQQTPYRMNCQKCGWKGRTKSISSKCPRCGSQNLTYKKSKKNIKWHMQKWL